MGRKDLALALALSLTGCAEVPAYIKTAADAAAPLLPELASLYKDEGDRCVAVATTRYMADACLVNLRIAWNVWDALEPIRGALDGLVQIEHGWQAAEAKRWPAPTAAACVTPPKAP